MTKDEALAKLMRYMQHADDLSVVKREVISSAMYEGALQRQRADCYRIAIAIVREIEGTD